MEVAVNYWLWRVCFWIEFMVLCFYVWRMHGRLKYVQMQFYCNLPKSFIYLFYLLLFNSLFRKLQGNLCRCFSRRFNNFSLQCHHWGMLSLGGLTRSELNREWTAFNFISTLIISWTYCYFLVWWKNVIDDLGLIFSEARKKFGLLEKHKDYVLRARAFHKKEETLRVWLFFKKLFWTSWCCPS